MDAVGLAAWLAEQETWGDNFRHVAMYAVKKWLRLMSRLLSGFIVLLGFLETASLRGQSSLRDH